MAEIENFTGNITENASGYVIEVNLDSRRGILATLIIKDGTIKKGTKNESYIINLNL